MYIPKLIIGTLLKAYFCDLPVLETEVESKDSLKAGGISTDTFLICPGIKVKVFGPVW